VQAAQQNSGSNQPQQVYTVGPLTPNGAQAQQNAGQQTGYPNQQQIQPNYYYVQAPGYDATQPGYYWYSAPPPIDLSKVPAANQTIQQQMQQLQPGYTPPVQQPGYYSQPPVYYFLQQPGYEQMLQLPGYTNRSANNMQAPGNATENPQGQQPATGNNVQPGSTQATLIEQARRVMQRPMTEFEALVANTLGSPLPVFGNQLFERTSTPFSANGYAPVSSSYPIGVGDQLQIHTWGSIQMDGPFTVDRNGQINLPRVGTVRVAGLRYDQLQQALSAAINQQFHDFNLSVSLTGLRSIQIEVLGAARNPGAHFVSSVSTLVNALFDAGGPSPSGSMRDIQLKRDGVVVADLDLYDLLVLGDKSKDMPLQDGDIVYIPPVGPRVAIAGSVNLQGIYELSGKTKTTLGDALRFADGLSTLAGSTHVTIEGNKDRTDRQLSESSLDQAMTHTLADGDIVRIISVSPRIENAVTLRGAVSDPGRRQWHAGMRVSDLIPSRESLVTRSYYTGQNGLAPRNEGVFGDRQNVTPYDFRSNTADINWEYAVIARLDRGTLQTRLVPFNLGRAIADPSSADNLVLQAEDTVTIFSQAELPVSIEHQSRYVTVIGEVNAPGVFEVQGGETLRDIVARAGGPTSHAYLFAADMRRASTLADQRTTLQKTVERLQADLVARSSEASQYNTADEAAAQRSAITMQQGYVQRLASVQPTGRIVLDIPTNAESADAIPALPLEDKDVIRIPTRSGIVQVIGAVNNENALIYHEGYRVRDYLAKAGGPTREADMKRMFVIRASGSVIGAEGVRRARFESLQLMPGDAIVVPNKLFSTSFLKGLTAWSQVIGQFALGVAAAKVLTQ